MDFMTNLFLAEIYFGFAIDFVETTAFRNTFQIQDLGSLTLIKSPQIKKWLNHIKF